jgi:hypothetical protein
LAHTFLWGCRYKKLKLAQLLGQLGVFLAYGAFGVFWTALREKKLTFFNSSFLKMVLKTPNAI